VKGFPKSWTHEDLYKIFEPFGYISSAKIAFTADLTSRGYGFVSMEMIDSAHKAIEGLHDKTLEEINADFKGEVAKCKLSVQEFVNKVERDGC
jgi:polyadenylate-binding protein